MLHRMKMKQNTPVFRYHFRIPEMSVKSANTLFSSVPNRGPWDPDLPGLPWGPGPPGVPPKPGLPGSPLGPGKPGVPGLPVRPENSNSSSGILRKNQGVVCLNIKMSYYQYRDPHNKDKTVSRPSYLNMGIPIPEKDGLYIETGSSSLYHQAINSYGIGYARQLILCHLRRIIISVTCAISMARNDGKCNTIF